MPSIPATDSYLRRYALCVAVLAVSLVLFPLLALVPVAVPVRLPGWLGNALFFWPQLLLLPRGLQSMASNTVYGAAFAPFLMGVFWLLAVAGVARLTLRWRTRWALPALFVAVASIAELLLLVVGALGLRAVLDGL
jgi:hypothetical protein